MSAAERMGPSRDVAETELPGIAGIRHTLREPRRARNVLNLERVDNADAVKAIVLLGERRRSPPDSHRQELPAAGQQRLERLHRSRRPHGSEAPREVFKKTSAAGFEARWRSARPPTTCRKPRDNRLRHLNGMPRVVCSRERVPRRAKTPVSRAGHRVLPYAMVPGPPLKPL